ncbi:MAG: excalibur calcium-binding domain-containing protein [Candidatus Moraniibacteriota bacterium]
MQNMQTEVKEKAKAVLDRATDYSGTPKRKIAKGVIGGIIVILLGALGLELSNNDFDLGSILSGNSVSDSKVMRDEKGNLQKDAAGNLVTRVMRDKEGNVVTSGGKSTDEYNCDDFATQPEAQQFFMKAGGVNKDTNRLDGNKDGEACESLPKGSK